MALRLEALRVIATASTLIGKRYLSFLRFHSSLNIRLSAGDQRGPNKRVDAGSAIRPATINIRPTSWIKKTFAI